MKKIMFSDKYGLTDAVLKGRKTMTRRIARFNETERPCQKGRDKCLYCIHYDREEGCKWLLNYSPYKIGEVVAVAQCYEDAILDVGEEKWNKIHKWYNINYLCHEKGLHNKMFVKADLMPHQIQITGLNIEKIQDISDEDCIKEGIEEDAPYYWVPINRVLPNWKELNEKVSDMYANNDGKIYPHFWDSPKKAFSALIDAVCGKGTWESNPYTFAYTFELVK